VDDDRPRSWKTLFVPIASNDPALNALHRALCELVTDCTAKGAAVIDDGNGLWCVSEAPFAKAADRFYREEIAMRPDVQLKRGGGLHLVRHDAPEHAYVAESFASIYVVIVFFDAAFDPFTARTNVRKALPKIEALTLALPPPFGPDAGGSSGKARA
jgi:hypothetical protein